MVDTLFSFSFFFSKLQALHGAGKLSEREQRKKDSGANIMVSVPKIVF